jgi:hypothetical protein
MILLRQPDGTGAQAADRCLRRGQWCAQVVADRGEQRRPHPASLRISGSLIAGTSPPGRLRR